MIKLTQEQADEIRDMLHTMYHDSFYLDYTTKRLEERLSEINDVIEYLNPLTCDKEN